VSKKLIIAAVGDISFEGKWAECPSITPFKNISYGLQKADLSIANLEGPLFDGNNPIRKKTTLRGSTRWGNVLSKVGFNVFSLANNHMMDHGEEGLFETIKVLRKAGIKYCGAGNDLKEACAPVYIDINDNMRIAFLGRSSVIVNSPSYAKKDSPGIAFFDMEETKKKVANCKNKAELVILMMHWGIEEYRYPAPDQKQTAKELIKAGADIIIGHHPHVMQGAEKINNNLVCYSLGNFLFDEFWWTMTHQNGTEKKYYAGLSAENRRGGILNLGLNKSIIESFELVTTIIDFDGIIQLDETSARKDDFTCISKRLHLPCYNLFWKIYAFRQEWSLRIKSRLRRVLKLKNIKKIRAHHIKELVLLIKKSTKIINEKTTNPYD
jgi:hypothetical protein